MDLWAPIIRGFIAPTWAWWERSPYLRHYRRLLYTQYDAPEVIRRRQWARIERLLAHAYHTTPFWRKRLDAAGLPPGRIRSLGDFRRVPLLTKQDLRAHGKDLLSRKYVNAKLHHKRTSGSTGVSVEVWVDDVAAQFKRGCVLRCDEWSGWRLGERVAVLWGHDEYVRSDLRGRLRNALLDRCSYLDTLRINEDLLAEFLAGLRRHPPSLLFGHAHSLYLLARFVESRGGPGFRPKGMISTAMVLHEWERRTIEEVFDSPVTDRYGCEEVSQIACECERHEGLHVNSDALYLELLRPDGTPVEPGEPGMVVVTDLVNRAMPMIRYQVGDMAVWAGRPCPCGRGLPILEKVAGRVADYVVTPRGRLVSGISLTDHFNTLVPGVAQMQIIQEALDHFVFRIVKDPGFSPASLQRIRSLVLEHFGADVRYECEFVERIPQEPSGKFRFCISRVRKPFVS